MPSNEPAHPLAGAEVWQGAFMIANSVPAESPDEIAAKAAEAEAKRSKKSK